MRHKNEKTEKQGTMRIVHFEPAVLQTGTESSSTKENSDTVLTLNLGTVSGQNNSKSL
jgi:hypothetical protein